jgi:hypothetical protein
MTVRNTILLYLLMGNMINSMVEEGMHEEKERLKQSKIEAYN